MRLNYSTPLLFLLLLIGCSKADHSIDLPEGRLELVWVVQPEEIEGALLKEPWFSEIQYTAVSNNYIYVSDRARGCVIQLDSAGNFIRTIGRKGGGPGEFTNYPSFLTFSPNGHLFVEHGGQRANEYSPVGEFFKLHSYVGIRIESAPSILLEWPVALDDTTLVWRVYPTGLDDLDEYLKVPPLIVTRGDEVISLGIRTLKELEDSLNLIRIKRIKILKSELRLAILKV